MDRGWLGGMRVHPLADIFPMLDDDELADLAADIKENGLLHPIVRTVDGETLVDGRNRLKACYLAEVDPVFEDRIASEDEAKALIFSGNITRRHLTKSQQAMAAAIIHPEAKRGRGNRDEAVKDEAASPFTQRLLQQARAILRDAPELVPSVLAGSLSIDRAIATSRTRAAIETPALRAALRRTNEIDREALLLWGKVRDLQKLASSNPNLSTLTPRIIAEMRAELPDAIAFLTDVQRQL
jgi:ParB-like chromosome segregation protein Spo0J